MGADVGREPIGIFYANDPEHQRVTGQNVVVDDFLEALLAYGKSTALHLFSDQTALPALGGADGEARAGEGVTIHAVRDVGDVSLAGWHDLTPDVMRCLTVRERQPRRFYPISFSTHNGHAQHAPVGFVLPLLLGSVRECDSVVCVSRSLRTLFEKMLDRSAGVLSRSFGRDVRFRGRLDLIPWGIDTRRFQPRPAAEARARYELPADAFVILYVGRVTPATKGDLMPAMRVVKLLAERHPTRKIVLAIAGSIESPGYDELLFAYAQHLGVDSRAMLLGAIKAEERHAVYACADVFLSLGDWHAEAFGLTPVEAMACGVPQVVSDWDGYRDTVVHGETGFLTPTIWADCGEEIDVHAILRTAHRDLLVGQSLAVDLDACVSQIEALLTNDDLRKRMGEASRARALAEFDWPRIVPRYEALWAELRARAATLAPDRDREGLFSVPIFPTYRHYASDELRAEDVVRLTPAGELLAKGDDVLPLEGRLNVMDDDLLVAIVEMLAAGGGEATLAETIARAGVSPGRATRHVLWLIKYGFCSRRAAG